MVPPQLGLSLIHILHDEKGPVGGGVHERFIINNAKFAAKAEAKKG